MRSYTDNVLQRRRLAWLISSLAFFGVILGARLFYLQVVEHGHYLKEASLEHNRKYQVPAKRGQIYTQDSGILAPLALNQTLKLLYADPRFITDKAGTAQKLAQITGKNPADYQKKLENGIEYAVLDERLSSEISQKITKLNLLGIGLVDRDYRTYPEGNLAAQVLGFVNADGVGQYGIEGYLNDALNGTPGQLSAKTDTHGIAIQTANNTIKAPVDGKSYVLTIDRNIQAEVEKDIAAQVAKVHAKSGSAIVMDPNTGKVVAMANYPSFDPNNYSKTTDYSVFQNQVVSNAFEPGSGIKVFTMATGLDKGVVTPDSTYDDPFCVKIDDRNVCDAAGDKAGKGKTMTVVLRDSLNTGVIHVLQLLGGDPNKINLVGKKILYDYFTKHFGFGVRTGIEQAGEGSGSVQPPSTNNVTYATTSFGQGMSATMIQMTSAMAAVANGGTLFQPQLVEGIINDIGGIDRLAPKIVSSHVISPQAAQQLNGMLQVVVQHGSGYSAYDPHYKIAGKTGTAQIARPDGKGYIDGANIGSFVGFAPADKPRFVLMVAINQPEVSGYAEFTTVPVFSTITQWLLKYYSIPPTS